MMAAGKSKPTEEIKSEPFEGCFPCYGGNGIRGYVNEYNQDGIFTIIGRQGALCGNINTASGKFYATEHAVVTSLFQGIDFNWSNYILEALRLNEYATGAAQPGLSVANVLNVYIPIPPLKEQQLIAQRISEASSFIKLIDDNQAEIAEAISAAKSKILDLAIRGQLVPQNPDDEPAAVLLARIREEKEELIKQGKIKRDKKESIIFKGEDNSYYEKMGNTIACIDEEIPFELPVGWEFVRLKDICELISGRDLQPNEYNSENIGIPYITGASNFSDDGISIERWTDKPQVISEIDDLLLTCKGTVGKIAFNTFGKAHIARQVMAIRNTFHINDIYLKICLEFYIDRLKGSAKGLIPGISRDDMLYLILPIPPIICQEIIVNTIAQIFKTICDIETSLN